MNMRDLNGERIETKTMDVREVLVRRIQELIPAAFTEGRLDVVALKQILGEDVVAGPARYRLTWAGKEDALALLQRPAWGTLVPVPEESIDWNTTQNIFIEGENLEVLKLLLKPYYGRVKLIYIDPPYNTGKDFIYRDDYQQPLETYLRLTGQKDVNGLLTSNPETSGRYHSDWLSMMYPRLWIARELLRDDGIMLVSIDDHEAHNLRILMNEIFGEENFIAQLVWEKGRKNDARLFSVGHEYVMVYARSKATLLDKGTVWREPKPGAQEVWAKYLELRRTYGSDDSRIEEALQEWYRSLPEGHPAKKLSRYKHVDKWGPWRDRDISWPGGDGPRYEVIHPVTGQPCKIPDRGWGFATPEAMQRQIALGLVVFREDHTEPPIRKAHLRPIPEELLDNGTSAFDEDDDENEHVGMQVMGSYIYKQSQVAVKYLRGLMGAKVFDNPKDHEVLARIFRYVTPEDEPVIVLDFFAGSGSSAEAVLRLNEQLGTSKYRFIAVQIPEPTSEKSAAKREGYNTITEIAKERLRRVAEQIRKDNPDLDVGFRWYRLEPSQFKEWHEPNDGEIAQLQLFIDGLRDGWHLDAVIAEVATKEAGFGLNYKVEKILDHPNTVYQVSDPDRSQSFFISLDDQFSLDTAFEVPLSRETLLVVRDTALDDATAANLATLCRVKTL